MTESQSTKGKLRGARRAGEAGENGGSRKAAILDVAVEMFGRIPYDDVAVSDIAAKAGVAHGLMFHYFGSKRSLYLAALERTLAELGDVHQASTDGMEPREVVRAIISDHLDYIGHHPETLLGFLRGGIGADPEVRQVIERSRWDGIEQILKLLNLRRPSGVIKMTMRGWVGFLDEVTIYWLEQDVRISRARIIDISMEALVAGLIQAGADKVRGALDPRLLLLPS